MKRIQQLLSCLSQQEVVLLFVIFTPLLLTLKTATVFGGDGGDLVTAAYVGGVAHPPGYPLYTAIAYLLTWMPWDTVAGRVVWLSLLPGLGSTIVTFLIVRRLGASAVMAFFAAAILGFSYLFLLLAIVPEVFALHLFLTTLLIYLLFSWHATGQKFFLSWFCFFFGLSLAHHHTVLLMVPAFAFLMVVKRALLPQSIKYYIQNTIYFLFGLLPYSYVYFAAQGSPAINWENPQTLSGFFRLVTRAIYGTFQSGQFFGKALPQRLYHLPIFFETLLIDFTILGCALAVIGIVYLLMHKKSRNIGIFILLGFLFTGPLFLIYASFPIGMNFQLGTIERFYLIPYLFIAITIAFGIEAGTFFITQLLNRISPQLPVKSLVIAVFALYPIALALTTIPKLFSLRSDQTAENLGLDVLQTTTPGSLLLLTEDTRLFDTSYVYFTSEQRFDTRLIFLGLLPYPFYHDDVVVRYPDIVFPTTSDASQSAQEFIATNAARYPIYADRPYPVSTDFLWVPWGILYKLYRVDDQQFNADEYRAINTALFANYQDPLKGALGYYKHVMLADVLRVYGTAYEAVATAFEKLGFTTEAQEFKTRSKELVK